MQGFYNGKTDKWIESTNLQNKLNMTKRLNEYPDPTKHQTVSFIKSGMRIVGYALLPFDILIATGVLLSSEVLGILEELV